MTMKNSNDTIGNRTCHFPACSAVSQPTAPPRAHERVWVDRRAIVQPEELSQWKIQVIPSGNETATFRLVASSLNQLHTFYIDSIFMSSLVLVVRWWYSDSSWIVMAHGDAREGKWRGNWRMEWVASTLHITSEHGVTSITTADAHTSAVSSRLNWRPPADLNGLIRFAERRNVLSARVPSLFNWPLL